MTLRAQRLLASVEAGTTNGSTLQTTLNSDLSLKQELLQLLGYRSFAKRAELSSNFATACSLSSHAMDAVTAHSYLMGLIGTAVSRRAFAILIAADISIAKMAMYHAGQDPFNITNLTTLYDSTTYTTAVGSYSTSRSMLFSYNNVASAVAFSHTVGNNTLLTHANTSGLYLNRLRQIDGLSSDGNLSAGPSLSTIAADGATYGTAVTASTSCLEAISKSSGARATVNRTSNLFTTSFTSAAAISKYAAGMAGLDVSTFSTMAHLAASTAALDAMFADSNFMTHLFGQATRLDELVAVSSFRNTYIGTGGSAYTTWTANAQAAAKLIAAVAGGSTAAVTSYATLWSTSGNAAAIGASNAAMTLVQQLSGATTALLADATAMDNLFAVANARTFIGYSGAFYDVIKVDQQAIAKYVYASAGQVTTAVTAVAATWNTTTYWNNVSTSVAAKMAFFHSDTFLGSVGADSTGRNSVRATASHSVITWTENGTTPVSLSALTGTHYVITGASRSTAVSRDVTVTTLRSGTTRLAVLSLDATGDTAANDSSTRQVYPPIVAPFTAVLSGTGSGTGYIGVFRCDA